MKKPSEFLRAFRPNGPWLLAAISFEGGGFSVKEFLSADDELDRWVAETNRKCNMYFHVNRCRTGMTKKAAKEDVEDVSWLHLDMDVGACPPGRDPEAWLSSDRGRILEALKSGRTRPTLVVFSGGGYQAYWKLKSEDVVRVGRDKKRADEATAYNAGLAREYAGSDSCQSVDHVMRLPGTTNWPDKKKMAANPARVPAEACVVWHEADREYSLGDFKPVSSGAGAGGSKEGTRHAAAVSEDAQVERVTDFRNDPRVAKVPDCVKALIVSGKSLEKEYGSRSECQWACSCALVRAGVDDETHFAILTDADLYVGQAVLTESSGKQRKGARRYAIKQIEDAREATAAEASFVRGKSGEVVPTLYENCFAAVKALGVKLSYDEFSSTQLVDGLEGCGPSFTDDAEVKIHSKIQSEFFFTPKIELFRRALTHLVHSSKVHPVRQYLSSLKWDGAPRVDEVLTRYLGAEDCEYVREVGRILMVAAVRRVMEPGIKFDEMVVLEGPQGAGKSQFLSILAVKPEWFQDSVPFGREGMKLVVEATLGRWICEIAELSTMKRTDKEHVKVVLSSQVDKARLSYERHVRSFPRQCVFVGTTNEDKYLFDMTGNRRFWPVAAGKIDLTRLREDRDQLWAEAFSRREEPIRLPESLWPEASSRQEDRREVDPVEVILCEALEGKKGMLRMEEVFACLEVPKERWSMALYKQVGAVLRKTGWVKKVFRYDEVPVKVWTRGSCRIKLEYVGSSFMEKPF